MLCELVRINQKPLQVCQDLIQKASNPSEVTSTGVNIYTEKKSLIGANGVTWTHEEYGHPGLQLMYLKMKSWQRFTETWALLERSGRLGLFEPHRSGLIRGQPVRVLSVGGGPGYELLAFRRFFRSFIDPSVPLHLVSLDLQGSWRPYVEAMGMRFEEWDIKSGGLLNKVADMNFQGVTYVIISYVMIYCTDDRTCDMLADLLKSRGVHCIFVSERGEETRALTLMEQRGIRVVRLIDQSNGKDDRQSAWLDRTTPIGPSGLQQFPTVFPNQPFEDKKRKRR